MSGQTLVSNATLQATWFSTNLSDLVPGLFDAVQPALEVLRISLTAAEVILEVLVILSALAIFVVDLPDLLDVAFQLAGNIILAVVSSKIDDLRQTGFSAIVLPITPGGMAGCAAGIKAALQNARDPRRPNFAPFSFLAGWAIVAAAPVGQIKAIFDAITKLLTLTERLQNQTGLLPVKPSGVFLDPFAANKAAGRARPLNLPPWVGVRLVDFVPGTDDALQALAAWARAMMTPIRLPPFGEYAAFIHAYFARLIAMITLIETLIALILTIFQDIPCKLLEFDVQVGSTQDLIDSIPRWFDPNGPALADVPPDWSTCGIFSVIGGVEPVTPAAQLELLRALFLPTPDPQPAAP